MPVRGVRLVLLPADVLERIADMLWYDVILVRKNGQWFEVRGNWEAANYLYKLAESDVMLK